MSDRARGWLAMRAGPVPPVLQARMEAATEAALEEDTLAEALADAARACLRDALAHGDDRSAALHLLAADALITYACEAAAECDDAQLQRLARSWSPERLGTMQSEATRS